MKDFIYGVLIKVMALGLLLCGIFLVKFLIEDYKDYREILSSIRNNTDTTIVTRGARIDTMKIDTIK